MRVFHNIGCNFFSTTDLKHVLEEARLGHLYHIFREQEVDYQLFITMNDMDLAEMGILDSSERAKLLTLVSKLTRSRKSTANGSSGMARQGWCDQVDDQGSSRACTN